MGRALGLPDGFNKNTLCSCVKVHYVPVLLKKQIVITANGERQENDDSINAHVMSEYSGASFLKLKGQASHVEYFQNVLLSRKLKRQTLRFKTGQYAALALTALTLTVQAALLGLGSGCSVAWNVVYFIWKMLPASGTSSH